MMILKFFSRPLLKSFFIIGLLSSFSLSVTGATLHLITGDSLEVLQLDWKQDSEEENQDTSEETRQLLGYNTEETTSVIINFYSYSLKEIFSPPPEM
ncbi:MAG: hypothetical protein EBY37_00875 [Flavobacteriia bacterium]|nr:hypothetical protein [Flavobacteriia bacterium]